MVSLCFFVLFQFSIGQFQSIVFHANLEIGEGDSPDSYSLLSNLSRVKDRS